MSSAIREWLNLGVRWIHVFSGIMWVGQTYYFTWLDGQFGKLEKKVAANGKASAVWMVHSGGFYSVEKQKSLGVSPEQVCWFRWEALIAWLSGVVLLVLVYYLGDGLIDPDVADISKWAGIAIGVGAMLAGRVRGIRIGDDGGRRVGIDALVQWTRCVHPRGSDLRDDHDFERVDAHSSRTAQDDRGSSSGPEIRCVAGRASEAAFEAQYVHGGAGRLSDAKFTLSGGNLREPVRLGNHVGAHCRGVGSSEVDSRILIESRLVP